MLHLPSCKIDFKEIDYGSNTEFQVTCHDCKAEHCFTVDTPNLVAWRTDDNVTIQAAFPYLEAWEREMLLSGLCTSCWDKKYLNVDA
jgi:hypothetical protein